VYGSTVTIVTVEAAEERHDTDAVPVSALAAVRQQESTLTEKAQMRA
jgi:hypothetical protein